MQKHWACLLILILSAAVFGRVGSAPSPADGEVRVTILSNHIAADNLREEFGFSALVQVGDRCILFDAGHYSGTVVDNSRSLGLDLSCVTDVVLSHFHRDHTGGLMSVLQAFKPDHPHSFQRIHVANGIFDSRNIRDSGEFNPLIAMQPTIESMGIDVLVHHGPSEIFPDVWITGNVERVNDEKNYNDAVTVHREGGAQSDTVMDSQGLAIATDKGYIVLTGCGHAGVINIITHVVKHVGQAPVLALVGGFHIQNAPDDVVEWTGDQLLKWNVENVVAAHCTGTEPVPILRERAKLSERSVIFGAVGEGYSTVSGIMRQATPN